MHSLLLNVLSYESSSIQEQKQTPLDKGYNQSPNLEQIENTCHPLTPSHPGPSSHVVSVVKLLHAPAAPALRWILHVYSEVLLDSAPHMSHSEAEL